MLTKNNTYWIFEPVSDKSYSRDSETAWNGILYAINFLTIMLGGIYPIEYKLLHTKYFKFC